jgi:hypothetical protein
VKLVYKDTGKLVKVGDIIPAECDDERTGMRVLGFKEPHKPSSGGKVHVAVQYGDDEHEDTREYFVSVIGAHWIEREDQTTTTQTDRSISNAARALWAGEYQTGRSNDEALADILADLMHWADCYAEDFEDRLRVARTHFEAEKGS